MPWCEPCARFVAGPMPGGECPVCGQVVDEDVAGTPRAPWHFKLLVASAGAYLLWRAVQGVGWLAGRL